MARSLLVDNLLPQNAGQLSTTCSNAIEITQWETPNWSRPQPATDNGVKDGWSNRQVAPPTLKGSTPWAPSALYKYVQSQLNRDRFVDSVYPSLYHKWFLVLVKL